MVGPQRSPALLLAAAIGVVTVILYNGAFSIITGAPLNLGEEWGVFAFQALVVAAPFLVLALNGITARVPWLAGLAMTAAFWGYYLYDGLARRGDGSGANIGLGLLFIVYPFIVMAICFAIAKRGKRQPVNR